MQDKLVGGDVSDIVDYGTAPVVYVNGLARVDLMRPDVLLAFWQLRTTVIDGNITQAREVVHNIVMPIEAVWPAIEMKLAALGRPIPATPRLLVV